MAGDVTREQIKKCFLSVSERYPNKKDNFLLLVMCEELQCRDKDYLRGVLQDMFEKEEL